MIHHPLPELLPKIKSHIDICNWLETDNECRWVGTTDALELQDKIIKAEKEVLKNKLPPVSLDNLDLITHQNVELAAKTNMRPYHRADKGTPQVYLVGVYRPAPSPGVSFLCEVFRKQGYTPLAEIGTATTKIPKIALLIGNPQLYYAQEYYFEKQESNSDYFAMNVFVRREEEICEEIKKRNKVVVIADQRFILSPDFNSLLEKEGISFMSFVGYKK